MVLKPIVIRSINDAGGTRCVDLLRTEDGTYLVSECRRDPEDNHGWRRVAPLPATGFPSEAEALIAARRDIDWLDMQLASGEAT